MEEYNGCYANGASFRTPLEENSIENQPQKRYNGCYANGVSFRTQPLDDSLDIPVVPQHYGKRHDGSNLITTTIEEHNPDNDVRMVEDITF